MHKSRLDHLIQIFFDFFNSENSSHPDSLSKNTLSSNPVYSDLSLTETLRVINEFICSMKKLISDELKSKTEPTSSKLDLGQFCQQILDQFRLSIIFPTFTVPPKILKHFGFSETSSFSKLRPSCIVIRATYSLYPSTSILKADINTGQSNFKIIPWISLLETPILTEKLEFTCFRAAITQILLSYSLSQLEFTSEISIVKYRKILYTFPVSKYYMLLPFLRYISNIPKLPKIAQPFPDPPRNYIFQLFDADVNNITDEIEEDALELESEISDNNFNDENHINQYNPTPRAHLGTSSNINSDSDESGTAQSIKIEIPNVFPPLWNHLSFDLDPSCRFIASKNFTFLESHPKSQPTFQLLSNVQKVNQMISSSWENPGERTDIDPLKIPLNTHCIIYIERCESTLEWIVHLSTLPHYLQIVHHKEISKTLQNESVYSKIDSNVPISPISETLDLALSNSVSSKGNSNLHFGSRSRSKFSSSKSLKANNNTSSKQNNILKESSQFQIDEINGVPIEEYLNKISGHFDIFNEAGEIIPVPDTSDLVEAFLQTDTGLEKLHRGEHFIRQLVIPAYLEKSCTRTEDSISFIAPSIRSSIRVIGLFLREAQEFKISICLAMWSNSIKDSLLRFIFAQSKHQSTMNPKYRDDCVLVLSVLGYSPHHPLEYFDHVPNLTKKIQISSSIILEDIIPGIWHLPQLNKHDAFEFLSSQTGVLFDCTDSVYRGFLTWYENQRNINQPLLKYSGLFPLYSWFIALSQFWLRGFCPQPAPWSQISLPPSSGKSPFKTHNFLRRIQNQLTSDFQRQIYSYQLPFKKILTLPLLPDEYFSPHKLENTEIPSTPSKLNHSEPTHHMGYFGIRVSPQMPRYINVNKFNLSPDVGFLIYITSTSLNHSAIFINLTPHWTPSTVLMCFPWATHSTVRYCRSILEKKVKYVSDSKIKGRSLQSLQKHFVIPLLASQIQKSSLHVQPIAYYKAESQSQFILENDIVLGPNNIIGSICKHSKVFRKRKTDHTHSKNANFLDQKQKDVFIADLIMTEALQHLWTMYKIPPGKYDIICIPDHKLKLTPLLPDGSVIGATLAYPIFATPSFKYLGKYLGFPSYQFPRRGLSQLSRLFANSFWLPPWSSWLLSSGALLKTLWSKYGLKPIQNCLSNTDTPFSNSTTNSLSVLNSLCKSRILLIDGDYSTGKTQMLTQMALYFVSFASAFTFLLRTILTKIGYKNHNHFMILLKTTVNLFWDKFYNISDLKSFDPPNISLFAKKSTSLDSESGSQSQDVSTTSFDVSTEDENENTRFIQSRLPIFRVLVLFSKQQHIPHFLQLFSQLIGSFPLGFFSNFFASFQTQYSESNSNEFSQNTTFDPNDPQNTEQSSFDSVQFIKSLDFDGLFSQFLNKGSSEDSDTWAKIISIFRFSEYPINSIPNFCLSYDDIYSFSSKCSQESLFPCFTHIFVDDANMIPLIHSGGIFSSLRWSRSQLILFGNSQGLKPKHIPNQNTQFGSSFFNALFSKIHSLSPETKNLHHVNSYFLHNAESLSYMSNTCANQSSDIIETYKPPLSNFPKLVPRLKHYLFSRSFSILNNQLELDTLCLPDLCVMMKVVARFPKPKSVLSPVAIKIIQMPGIHVLIDPSFAFISSILRQDVGVFSPQPLSLISHNYVNSFCPVPSNISNRYDQVLLMYHLLPNPVDREKSFSNPKDINPIFATDDSLLDPWLDPGFLRFAISRSKRSVCITFPSVLWDIYSNPHLMARICIKPKWLEFYHALYQLVMRSTIHSIIQISSG